MSETQDKNQKKIFDKNENTNTKDKKANTFNFSYKSCNLKNKRASNKLKKNNKKLKINSISDIEYFYNDSQGRTSNTINKMRLKKQNLINLSSNNQNSTDFLSTKYNRHSRQTKTQNSLGKRTFNEFWQSVKDHENEKKIKINNLKSQIINSQIQKESYTPKISKRSISLINLKKRAPLYLKNPLNEEKNMDDYFKIFYNKNLDSSVNYKTKSYDENRVKEKFDKFYEDNITWKKKINNHNELVYEKNERNQKKYSFKPILNKNSLDMVKKQGRINSHNSMPYNYLNNFEIEKEIIDQLNVKLRPILREHYDSLTNKTAYINKRSICLIKNKTNKNKEKKLNKNKSYQNLPNENILKESKKNTNIIIDEKNKKESEKVSKEKFKTTNKLNYENYLLQKFKEIDNTNKNDKKYLYKLNIRQGTPANFEIINKIIPKRKYGFIIEDLL